MELNEMIKELIDSGITENQELGLTLITAEGVSEEEKRMHIEKFIQDYVSGKVNFEDEEHKKVFEAWKTIYLTLLEGEVKTRVKRIE